jgi:acyl transferase domain-containing protein
MVKRSELESVKQQLADETRRADSAELDLRRVCIALCELREEHRRTLARIASLEEANTYMSKRLAQYSEVGQ